ncbi:hypothetical protein ACFOEK_13205 [Litoribrevibacter euphylliae]|uniref:LPP20 lipoprotein n=1 Tax=Litoribrevibacter euphylliae TaxID=1834034 RepID=A0ABV7HH69_9GAMM
MHALTRLMTSLSLIFTLALTLTACQTLSTSIPDWVTNPTQDNDSFSAVGEGISLKEAQVNAQQALASQLLSHVSNELTVLAIADGDFHRTYTERLSKASFHDIPLPAVRFNRATKVEGTYFAEVELDKNSLRAFLETNLDTLIKENTITLSNIQGLKNPFEQWWQYEMQSQQINSLADQTLIHNSLFTPKNEKAADLLKQFNIAYNQSKSGLILAINDDTPVPGLTNALESQLSKHGIITKKVRFFSTQPELHATLSNQTQHLQGDYYAASTLTLDLKSHKGQTMSSITLSSKGVSISSKKEARTKSYQKLLKQLKETDVIQRLKSV